jgi:glycosyltransferase involved in cell wall biosynthesis
MAETFVCPVSEQLIPQRDDAPVLSIIIMTYNRVSELAVALDSMVVQMDAVIGPKVEIIISDNASEPGVQDQIRSLANLHPSIGYVFNERNIGAEAHIGVAPFRARGRWMWIFGDDDLVLEGGLAQFIKRLEEDQPAFLTVNRCVFDGKLQTAITGMKHDVPNRNFGSFLELFKFFGPDQLNFLSVQIYETQRAREKDYAHYREFGGAYGQVGYYFDVFVHLPAAYENGIFVVHRWHADDHIRSISNFYNWATKMPKAIARARDLNGVDSDLFEVTTGYFRRSLETSGPLTFVDNILMYLWRVIGYGHSILDADWEFLEQECLNWKPGRQSQLQTAHQTYKSDMGIRDRFRAALASLEAEIERQNGLGLIDLERVKPLQSIATELGHMVDQNAQRALDASQQFQ